MKTLRNPIVVMYVIFAVLAVAVFIFIRKITTRDATEMIPQPSNVEYTRWELPDGAKARLGKGQVNDIKFSPDGIRFAVATTIGVWMYEAKTGKELSLLKGDRQDIKGIAFSTDGSTLTGANSEGEISRWDVDTSELHNIFTNETAKYIYKVDFSEDSTKLGSVSLNKEIDKVYVWNLDEGMPPAVTNIDIGKKEGIGPTISLSPDNRFIATAKEEKDEKYPIHLWNADTGERLLTLEKDEHGRIKALVFSTDNKTLASCDYDSILLWDIDTATPRSTFKTDFGLRTLAFSPNGKLLASGDDDGIVCLWNATVQQQGFAGRISQHLSALKLKKHKADIAALAFSPDGKMLLSGSVDGTIRAWDTTTGQQQYICPGHVGEVSDIAASAEGSTLISVHSREDKLIKWDVNTGHPLSSSIYKLKRVETISPNANTLVIEDFAWRGKLKLWDVPNNHLKFNLKGHDYPSKWWNLVHTFSSNGEMVAVTSSKHQIGVIHLWDIANPSKSFLGRIFNSKTIHPKFTFQGNQHEVEALAFSPNGKMLASSDDGSEINLWNTEVGNKLFTFSGHQRSNDNLVFSPDGNMLASVDYTIIYLWNLTTTTHKLLRKIKNSGSVQALQFSQDGRTLVAGTWDGKIHLLDAESGSRISTHIGHKSYIKCSINKLVFLNEGKTLASASEDGTIILWDWEKIANIRN